MRAIYKRENCLEGRRGKKIKDNNTNQRVVMMILNAKEVKTMKI